MFLRPVCPRGLRFETVEAYTLSDDPFDRCSMVSRASNVVTYSCGSSGVSSPPTFILPVQFSTQ